MPFEAGFLVLAERAEPGVPIVPVGLWYAPRPAGGWTVWLRFGRSLDPGGTGRRPRRMRLAEVEAEVRRLSGPPPA